MPQPSIAVFIVIVFIVSIVSLFIYVRVNIRPKNIEQKSSVFLNTSSNMHIYDQLEEIKLLLKELLEDKRKSQ